LFESRRQAKRFLAGKVIVGDSKQCGRTIILIEGTI
jgi:hypothetical protein